MHVQNHLFYTFYKKIVILLLLILINLHIFYSFMSTLLTAVLTHHLGWVPTIVPDNQATSFGNSHGKEIQHDLVRLIIIIVVLGSI